MAVEIAGRGREHLTDPVRRKGEEGCVGKVRHALAPPAGKVGNDDILAEVKLRLVDDPPAAGATFAEVERVADLAAKNGTGACVRRGGSRLGVERPADDLGHHMRRRVDHVAVSRPACRTVVGSLGPGHLRGLPTDEAPNVAWRRPER